MTTTTKAQSVFELIQTFWPVPEGWQPATPSDAVQMARDVAGFLHEATTEAGLNVGDAHCRLACATKDGLLVPLELRPADLPPVSDLELARKINGEGAEPIGIITELADHEKKSLLIFVSGFRSDERTQRLLSSYVRAVNAAVGKLELGTLN